MKQTIMNGYGKRPQFEEQYLVNIIEHPHYHTDDEVIEYCERLASHLKEWAFLTSIDEKYGEEA